MKYYTIKEIAKELKVHPETIRRYIKSGKLKAKKLSRSKIVVSESDYEKFLSR